MCGGPEQSKSSISSPPSTDNSSTNNMEGMTYLTIEAEGSSILLELAADDDVEQFEQQLQHGASTVNEAGLWYGHKKGSRRMVFEHRTPLMVAATYGSVDVLKFMVVECGADVNLCCVPDKCTALHCAASGGSGKAVEVVKLLLEFGADSNAVDVNGLRPFDVIAVPPKLAGMRALLEELLLGNAPNNSTLEPKLRISIRSSTSSSLSSSPENGSPFSPSDLVSSPMILKSSDLPANPLSEKKEYPVDPSLPDIRNSIYATDEFRMFSFKIRPCSRAYSHDWTECPFVHPGENARRRDPRKYHYSCVPCPEFRKGACRLGDMCEYAHGVFECWLHPAQYRTRLCKDGTSCNRRVCFFAHTPEELRPLYPSTGSAVPSPCASASGVTVMDMAAALNVLPGSPSSPSVICPSPFSLQPMSPSMNGIAHLNGAWPQANAPTLHLSGSNLQSSRLRSSLSARDIPPGNLSMLSDFDVQHHVSNDLSSYLQFWSNHPSLGLSGWSKSLAPSNLEELFTAEIASSPRYSDQAAALFSPTHKSAVLNHFQQQQSMLSPINSNISSPKNVEHPLAQASFHALSPGGMSARSVEPISQMSERLSAMVMHEKQLQLRCLRARDLGSKQTSSVVGSPVSSWTNCGSLNGKVDWYASVGDVPGQLCGSSSFELKNNSEEPDLLWIHSLVNESPPGMKGKLAAPSSGAIPPSEWPTTNASLESVDHSVLGA